MAKGGLGVLLLAIGLAACWGLKTINLDAAGNDRYTQRHNASSINYTSCRDMELKNNEDYSSTESPGIFIEECHVKFLPKLDEEKICCPHHDYLATGVCNGIDKNGDDAIFDQVDVCLPQNGGNISHEKADFVCPTNCIIKKGSMADASVQGDSLTINGKDESISNFCVGYTCKDVDDEDNDHYDVHMHQIWQKTYEVCICEDVDNSGLAEPLCCGEDGIYSKDTKKCIKGTMPASVADQLEACNSTRQTVEVTDPKESAICNSFTIEGKKAVECRDHCKKDKCIQMCSAPGDAFNWADAANPKVSLPEDYDALEMLGVEPPLEAGELIYNEKQHNRNGSLCQNIDSTIFLFPGWKCDDFVEYQSDGSMTNTKTPSTNDKTNRTARYGEFCIEPLAGDTSRGKYRIKTCWMKEKGQPGEVDQQKDETYRHVILWISIICLLITIILYAGFRNALLRSDYNKIMMNFAVCLLVAFLTMVVLLNLGKTDHSWPICTGVTITNQFSFHSAFFLMTLMSYNISRQIHQGNIQQSSSGFLKRLLIAYAIPGAIALITLIVELSAPMCSSIRPKFGMKSCHFYGDMDKFVFFYLPVLILLLINTGMFIFIMVNLIKNMKSSAGKKSGRKELADKMCIYLRLFLGMGIVWYAEILSWVLKDENVNGLGFVFTNALNMCQGVWVILIFVCKRNVVNVVTNKSKHLYSVVGRMGNSMGMGQSMQLRPQVSVASTRTSQFSVSVSSYAPVREETGLL